MSLARDERREAQEELLTQARYYELEHPGLGLDFLDAVDAAIDAIEDFPAEREPAVRVKQVEGFPVGIVYLVDNGTLVIFAYAHHQRDADYWIHRFEG